MRRLRFWNYRLWLGLLIAAALLMAAQHAYAQIQPTDPSPDGTPAPQSAFSAFFPAISGGLKLSSSTPDGPYRRLTDDVDLVSVQAPAAWSDIESGPWPPDRSAPGVFVTAAPDLDAFAAGQGPGLFYAVTRSGIPAQAAEVEPAAQIRAALAASAAIASAQVTAAGCTDSGIAGAAQPYADNFVTGLVVEAGPCATAAATGTAGGTGAADPLRRYELTAMPLSQNYVVTLRIAAPDDQFDAIVAQARSTFQVLEGTLTDPHQEHSHGD